MGLHSVGKVLIQECVNWEEGTKDTCYKKINGKSYRPEDDHDEKTEEDEEEVEEESEPDENIEEVLERYIAEIYNDLGTKKTPWLEVENKSWYR